MESVRNINNWQSADNVYRNDVRRGQVYYITSSGATASGCEQAWGRPAVIVSSDDVNRSTAADIEAVFFTTREKASMPTHVPVHSLPRPSIALCEQIHTIPRECLGKYSGDLTKYEMERIDNALAISLALPQGGTWMAPAGSEGVRRGESYYVVGDPRNKGRDEQKMKPAVVVSNDTGNHFSPIVEIVFLTKQSHTSKKPRPTRAAVSSEDGQLTAICSKIHTIDKRRLSNRIGRVSEHEMAGIDRALAAGLGLPADNEFEKMAAAV